jgi:hypothetical protein
MMEERGIPLQLRMIDGQLSFPDETPTEDWKELRVGTPSGIIAVRRATDGVALAIWGNADLELRLAWNALTWAFAEAGAGLIQCEQGELGPSEFAQHTAMPPG